MLAPINSPCLSLEALKNNIDELKREIEELKYFNRVLSHRPRAITAF